MQIDFKSTEMKLAQVGAGFIFLAILMLLLIDIFNQALLISLGLCGLGIVLIVISLGMITSGSSISHRSEDAGFIEVRTTQGSHLFTPLVNQPPTTSPLNHPPTPSPLEQQTTPLSPEQPPNN